MSAIEIGLGLAARRRRRTPAFSPAGLFAGGEQGAWYDPSDLQTLFQDGGGTVPAVLDGPVGRIADKSGRGNHAVQAGAGSRPLLKQDGGGRFYLLFDGADDFLRALFAIAQPFDRLAAIRHGNSDNNSRHSFGGGSMAGGILLHHPPVPSVSLFAGATAVTRTDFAAGANAVTTERFDGAASRLAINGSAYATGNPGSTAPGGITIGGRHDGGTAGASALRLYGLVMRAGTMSDAQIGQLRAHLAVKAGVVL